jgi:uncharacterized membrane protein HdeD (DUF308 family)
MSAPRPSALCRPPRHLRNIKASRNKGKKCITGRPGTWWLLVLRGGAAILLGVLTVFWPDITLLTLVVMFGIYLLIDGITTLASAAASNANGQGRALLASEGLTGIPWASQQSPGLTPPA